MYKHLHGHVLAINSLDVKQHEEQVVEHVRIKECEADRFPKPKPRHSGDCLPGFDAFRFHITPPKPKAAFPRPEAQVAWDPGKSAVKRYQ